MWIPEYCDLGRTFLWMPPPAAADAMLEELLKTRHKRTDTYHVIVIPRLMLPQWRRLFNKVCDFTVEVSPGPSFWPDAMFEPMWVGVVLRFTHYRPWGFKRAPVLMELGIRLRGVLLTSEVAGRDILWKLWSFLRALLRVSERVARGMLHLPWAGYLPAAQSGRRGRQPLAQRGATH